MRRAEDCEPDGRDAAETLRIDGLVDRATLARPSNRSAPLALSVRAWGSEGRVRWLLDGRWLGESLGAGSLAFELGDPGVHTLTALAESGAWASIGFRVLR